MNDYPEYPDELLENTDPDENHRHGFPNFARCYDDDDPEPIGSASYYDDVIS
jgi:hypothetical protein